MATQVKTWEIIDGELRLVESTLADEGRTEAYDLEDWIAADPSIIGSDIAIIGRQVATKSGPLDLLGIDHRGNAVVIELKRDRLPRAALCQAVDYASDVADWSLERLSEICTQHAGQSLEDLVAESFPDVSLEILNINQAQRMVLVGFAIESSLERMVNWLSDTYGVNINVVLLSYTKTSSGSELLTRTSLISEETEMERIRKRRFQIEMSDEPGQYQEKELRRLLEGYLSKDLYSARRLRDVLVPACLERGVLTRDELKQEFVKRGEAENLNQAGHFLSLISQQVGMAKNDFLRQIIGYEYPNYSWEKDNYRIRGEHRELVSELLATLQGE